MAHPDRVRQHYTACEIGDAPHRFIDTVNGKTLSFSWRSADLAAQVVRVCFKCGQTEAAILAKATPEHLEDGWNTLEPVEH